jgi:hypothetical protein
MFGTHLVLLALQKPGLKNLFSLVRPNTGEALHAALSLVDRYDYLGAWWVLMHPSQLL